MTATISTAPSPPARARLAGVGVTRLVEGAYAAFLLLMLTQGPVLSLWLRRTQEGQSPAELGIQATYLLVQLPALLVLARTYRRGATERLATAAVVAVGAFVVLSTAWSTLRVDTAVSATSLLVTIGAGLYLASRFSAVEQVVLLFVAMQPGLLASEYAVRKHWFAAQDTGFNWTGIYFNRNSLGPPAALGAAAAILLLPVAWRRLRTAAGRGAAVAVLVVAALYDLRLLRLSGSATSYALGALTVGVTAGWWLLARTPLASWGAGRRRGAGAAYAALLAAGFGLVYGFRDQISRALNRPAGFDGRTIYWEASFDALRDRPLLGWGWLSAWRTPLFKTTLPDVMKGEIWSHSAYIDVVLGTGVVGGVLFGVFVVLGFANAGALGLTRAPLAGWPIGIATAVALTSTQESFFIGGHFLCLLLVAGLCSAGGVLRGRAPHHLDSTAAPAVTEEDECADRNP